MTASSPPGATNASTTAPATSASGRATRQAAAATTSVGHHNHHQQQPSQASCPSTFNSSATFQQIKQTQASLARLCRVHQLNQQQQQQQQPLSSQTSGNNQSSQQQSKQNELSGHQQQQQQQQKPTTFVDCLIRRFKDCFSEDFCTVPMFVVGNLSPGSDGTHLILPPCVSLGRQSINRFASPKNLRLMNSIRESCRSIEELDLGGNKLTDLIEVYKILQCTPNLRFLNLSENDLSRTSPVAMASSTNPAASSSPPHFSFGPFGSSSTTTTTNTNYPCHNQAQLSSGRNYLAPINQNHQSGQTGGSAIQAPRRHHSTLGQTHNTGSGGLSTHQTTTASSTPNTTTTMVRSPNSNSNNNAPSSSMSASSHATPIRTRQSVSRVAEARRLAATNALAQSKKTSSLVASKLAQSVATQSLVRQSSGTSRRTLVERGGDKPSCLAGRPSQRHPSAAGSTMHLARSLSSLSAKDVRAVGSAAARLSGGSRAGLRKESSASQRRASIGVSSLPGAGVGGVGPNGKFVSRSSSNLDHSATSSRLQSSAVGIPIRNVAPPQQKLYVEPINEAEDVDMGAEVSQVSPNQQQATGSSNSNNNTSTLSSGTSPAAPTGAARVNQTGYQTRGPTFGSGGQSLLATTTNFRRTFESIKALALNNTGCQWRVVCSILSRMPNLEELHLSLNNYEKIDLDPNEFRHHSLKRLYLCNNPKLTNWEELDKLLIAFPSLEALSIADCNISQIPENLGGAREWRKLCGLNINGWPIKEWPVVERLNQLPSLIDLKCRNLEVLSTIDEPRHHLIARLPKLQRLNGSEIEEREHAEKAFLRFFMANTHLERPSRFHELIQIHGEVLPVDVDVDLSPPSQANVRVIYLNRNYFKNENEDEILMSEDFLMKLMDNVADHASSNPPGDAGCGQEQHQENMDIVDATSSSQDNKVTRLFKDEGQEVVALSVDLRQTVRKFKSTIGSIFGLESQNLILYYIDHEMVGLMGPELIKHNQKKLWNYNVQDGDQFIVEER